jgi:four helix bundle protein
MKEVLNGNRRVESWKDLDVWKIAHSLVLKLYEITKCFPNEERFRVTDQICRAAVSIPTNIAEGKGRRSLREYIQFLSIASRLLKKSHRLRCAQSPRCNVLVKYASARRLFARLASDSF